MSDRVDTEAVRRAWPITEDTQHGSPVAWMNALCDELDRTREALREYGQHTTACAYSDWKWGVKPAHLKRGIIPPPEPECDCGLAVLAESGNTELPNFTESGKVPQPVSTIPDTTGLRDKDSSVRCPTCGSDRRLTYWTSCILATQADPWHRTTDTEGEK